MYKPIQTGIPRALSENVHYQEFYPDDSAIEEMVYCFWTLQTNDLASEDFGYVVLPDGCIDIIFDISTKREFEGVLVMTPSRQVEVVRIRNNSSYVGIRLLPGVWQAAPVEIVGSTRFYDTLSGYDFTAASALVRAIDSQANLVTVLEVMTRELREYGIINASKLMKLLLAESFNSVQDMISITGYSRRQLQRILRDSVGYVPHDFVKIVRFQRALRNGTVAAELYSDRSHFIRECKRITGMTPTQLRTTYQLMADISNDGEM